MRSRAGWAAAILLLAAADASAATPRVGLVVATHVNLSEGEADSLASRLGAAMVDQLDVDVIAGKEARRRLPLDGIAEDCVARPACVRDVATRLDGDELLFLFLVRVGKRLQIDVTWVDAHGGSASSRPALVVDESPGSTDTADRVFAAAPPGLLPHAAPRRRVEASEPVPLTPARAAESSHDALSSDMPVPLGVERRHGRRFTVPVIATGAVAAAALATGIGFAVAARQDYDSLEADGCSERICPGVNGRIDKMERRALVADVLFAGAGAAAVTSLILYITSDGPEPGVRLGATDGGAVMSLAGRF